MAKICEICGRKKKTDVGSVCVQCLNNSPNQNNRLSIAESEEVYSEFRWNVIMGHIGIRTVAIPVIKSEVENG